MLNMVCLRLANILTMLTKWQISLSMIVYTEFRFGVVMILALVNGRCDKKWGEKWNAVEKVVKYKGKKERYENVTW